jgi:hypothetical protein
MRTPQDIIIEQLEAEIQTLTSQQLNTPMIDIANNSVIQ